MLKQLDGSFYNIFSNKFYFTLDGEYSNMTSLNWKVYDYKRASQTGIALTHNALNNGDNRYSLNVASLSSGYYVLEVWNQKNEHWYLRFKK